MASDLYNHEDAEDEKRTTDNYDYNSKARMNTDGKDWNNNNGNIIRRGSQLYRDAQEEYSNLHSIIYLTKTV